MPYWLQRGVTACLPQTSDKANAILVTQGLLNAVIRFEGAALDQTLIEDNSHTLYLYNKLQKRLHAGQTQFNTNTEQVLQRPCVRCGLFF